MSPTAESSLAESSGQQSGFGVVGLLNASTLGEGMLDRDEVGELADTLPLRARFLGGETDKETGRSSFF